MMPRKHVYAEDDEAVQFRQDAGLVPGQYFAEEAYYQRTRQPSSPTSLQPGDNPHPGSRDTRTKFQSGLSSTMLDGSSQHTGRSSLPSKNVRNRERFSGRNRLHEDRRAQRSDEVDPKTWSGSTIMKAAAKKVSTFLEPELNDDHHCYADEQDDRLDFQVADMQDQIHRLSTLNRDQSKLIAALRVKLKAESANSESIKESANKMAFAMESKELFVGRQDSDDVVISRFGLFVGQIKTWSVPFAAQERIGPRTELSEFATQDLRRVAPGRLDFDRLLQKPKDVRLFVRGWVGLVISETLFRTLPTEPDQASHGKDIWMDQEISRSFALIEDRLVYADRNTIKLRELHDWRALSAGLVSKLDTSSKTGKGMEGHVSDCSRQIMSLIGPWVDLEIRKKLEDDLLDILLQAVKLSQILRCQRASWSIRHVIGAKAQELELSTPDTPVILDEAVMDDKHGDDDSDDDTSTLGYQKIVDTVVTPGLFKRGNTDGEYFEFESCIVPAEVRCFRQPPKRGD